MFVGDRHELITQLTFHKLKFLFGDLTLTTSFPLDFQGLLDGFNQAVLSMLQGLDVDDATFRFAGCVDGRLLEHVGITFEQVVSSLGDLALANRGILLTE